MSLMERRSTRREILKGAGVAATAVVGGLTMPEKDSGSMPTQMAIEASRHNAETVIPVFGWHQTGSNGFNNELNTIYSGNPNELLVNHGWPKIVENTLTKIQPSIVSLDGARVDIDRNDPAGTFKRGYRAHPGILYHLPANPYKIKPQGEDLFFLMGDVPFDFKDYYFGREYISDADSHEISKAAFGEFFEKKTSKKFGEDPNIPLNGKAIETLHMAFTVETIASIIGAGAFLSVPKVAEKLKRNLNRRKTLGVMAGGGLAALNAARLALYAPFATRHYEPYDYPHAIPFDKDAAYNPSKLPLSSLLMSLPSFKGNVRYTNFRESITSLKLREARRTIPEIERSKRPMAATWGTFHRFGENHWTDNQKTLEIVSEGIRFMVRDAAEITNNIYKNNRFIKKPFSQTMGEICAELAGQLGSVGIARFSGTVETPTTEDFMKDWHPETAYISPTIIKLLEEAVKEEGIETDMEVMKNKLLPDVQGPQARNQKGHVIK